MAVTTLKNLLALATLALLMPVSGMAAEQKAVAKLSDANGTVMVDSGKGFVTTKADTSLYENDRVITLDGSMAEITYTDGCRTKLKSNNLIVINVDPGCKAAILDATKAAPAPAAPTPVASATHPVSYVLPVIGAWIVWEAISDSTQNLGWNEE